MAKREVVLWETETYQVIGEVDEFEPGKITYGNFFDALDVGWVEVVFAVVGGLVLGGLAVFGAWILIVAVLT